MLNNFSLINIKNLNYCSCFPVLLITGSNQLFLYGKFYTFKNGSSASFFFLDKEKKVRQVYKLAMFSALEFSSVKELLDYIADSKPLENTNELLSLCGFLSKKDVFNHARYYGNLEALSAFYMRN